MKKNSGLGKGLDALLPSGEDGLALMVQELNVLDIDPNNEQPRRTFTKDAMSQLAQSIQEVGVLQPITVVESGSRYRIVAGERRWRAAREAGLQTIPAIVRDMDRIQQMEAALIENLQREDLNPIEEASAVRALMQQCGYTQEAVAQKLGKSRPAVANLLRLLNLPDEVTEMVKDGTLSAGHARVLAGLPDDEQKISLAHMCIKNSYSVRQLEQIAAAANAPEEPKPSRPVKELPTELSQMETKLRETLGLRATLSGSAKRGKIVLQYYSNDELEKLYEALERLQEE